MPSGNHGPDIRMPSSVLPTDSRAGWRRLLHDLEVRPSKRMGQNFLTDEAVVGRIAQVAGLRLGGRVLEVGPGLGILTRSLLDAVGERGHVTVVELDRRLAAHLREAYAANPALRVVEGDILRQSLRSLVPDDGAYAVVANLPYNITSAVLRYFLEDARRPASMVVMVQDEVARRIVAQPPEMSILAVAVQFYGEPEVAFTVDRAAFTPRPRVDSAVVRIEVRRVLPLSGEQVAHFFTLVRAGFAQRRKQILNSLAARLPVSKDVLASALTRAGIDPTSRAEALSVGDWVRLSNAVAAWTPA